MRLHVDLGFHNVVLNIFASKEELRKCFYLFIN